MRRACYRGLLCLRASSLQSAHPAPAHATVCAYAGLSFPLDHRQSVEFLLTTAMSAFAVLLIAPRLLSWKVGLILLGPFISHLFFVDTAPRLIFAYVYFDLAAALIVADRGRVRMLVMSGSWSSVS